MPENYLDCIEKVKAEQIKNGKSPEEAEKSAYAICSELKKGHKDAADAGKKIEETEDELIYRNVLLTKEMVQKFENGKKMLKPADELKKAIPFMKLWFVNEHPSSNHITSADEIIGDPRNIHWDDQRRGIAADVHIFKKKIDPLLLRDIRNGKKVANSIGYNYDEDPAPGVFEGQAYDAVQRNIFINHLALVDEGRCSILDGCGLLSSDKRARMHAGSDNAGQMNGIERRPRMLELIYLFNDDVLSHSKMSNSSNTTTQERDSNMAAPEGETIALEEHNKLKDAHAALEKEIASLKEQLEKKPTDPVPPEGNEDESGGEDRQHQDSAKGIDHRIQAEIAALRKELTDSQAKNKELNEQLGKYREADRQALIKQIISDSALKEDDLKDKTLCDLKEMQDTIKLIRKAGGGTVSLGDAQAEDRQNQVPKHSVGRYDKPTGKWLDS